MAIRALWEQLALVLIMGINIIFYMILEQNYIKIVEYTQKAFKIFCRRSLGSAIIKSLQRNNVREKQNFEEDNEQMSTLFNYNRKLTSEDNLLFSSAGLRDQSLEQDSVKSQDKRTQNNLEKMGSNFKSCGVQDKLQILYGDLVYIQYHHASDNNLRAKYFLNKLKFCFPEDIGIGSSSDLRCIFQIVYPSSSLQQQKRGTLLTESCLVSFRTISKNEYLKVKNSKIVYSDEFGKELELSKHFNQNCVFELKYEQSHSNQQSIISGEELYLKLFGQMLYMNVLDDEQEAFFSQTPAFFTLKKLQKKPQNLVPVYYKMKSNKFQAAISGNPIELQSISQKKTMVNVIAINEKNMENKINPLNFIQFDFNKIPQQDPKISPIKEVSPNMLNCWEFIQFPDKTEPNLYQLYNPVIGLGLAIKAPKNVIKLTSNSKQFSVLKLTHHDEDILSFCSEANLQELDIIYDGQNTHKFIMVLSKPEAQNQSKKIKIKHINTKTAYMICELTQILDVLKSVYEFLDAWGNEADEKLQTIYYSVKQIKLGSSMMLKKVRQMKMVIKILRNYLTNPQNYTVQIQNTIHEMKILQMIINICKVITNKIGNIYPSLQNDQQSPFCFAKINLEEILKSLFSVLLKLTKDNIPNSNVVISEVDFFNQILIYYPEQIGEILQESIKNLSVITTKNNNQTGSNQLFLWVKLIEPVRQETIRIQKTYIDIIAEVVVDPTDKGIPIYQNRCKQLLFIQNSKRKCIPKFGVNEKQNKPIIIFESESMMSEFLQKNHHLSKLNLVQPNSASYFIQDFFCDRYTPEADISQQYIGYIGSIIKMFRNLCRNRNKKLFKIVDDWGINQEHIHLILNSKKIAWFLKANYLSLWSAIFIDEDPFLPFEKRESKCHYWPKISKYSLQDCTALIFKQYTDQTLAISKLNEFTLKIYPILSSYFFYLKKKIPAAFTDPTELKSFLIVLNTVYEIINLGYMTLKSMKDTIGIILHLLIGMDEVVVSRKSNQQELQKYYYCIIDKFIEILRLYEDIWVEIYGIQFLITFYKQSQTKNYCLQWQRLQKKWQNILTTTLPQQQPSAKPNPLRKRTRHNVLSQNQNTLLTNSSIQYFILQVPLSYQEVDNQIYDYVVSILTKKILEIKCENYQKLVDLLDCRSRRRNRICLYLREIMIFNDQNQEQIYRNFSGRESNKLLNWLKIQQIVLKINEIEGNNNKDELEQRTKKQKILELNNIVVKIIRQMTMYKNENTSMFIKCQMVLQKLNVHTILLDILKYHEKPVYRDVIRSTLDFVKEFTHQNAFNSRCLVPHLDKLVKNMSYPSLVQILPRIIESSKKSETVFKTTNDLIYRINHSETSIYLLTIISRLLSIEAPAAHTQQLKNNLSRRILELYQPCFRGLVVLDDRDLKDNQRIFRSFEFVAILCKLAPTCSQLQSKLKNSYPKCHILQHLKKSNNYNYKKIYLKILCEVYIKNKQLQNFQIQDFLQILVVPQLKKLPPITIKLIQKHSIATEKQSQIHSLYEELLSFSNVKIETRDEEAYYHFILDLLEVDEVSLLTFAKLIMGKWKNMEHSDRLDMVRLYLRKLEMLLYLIYYEESSIYHRGIFQQIQQLNILLQCQQQAQTPHSSVRKQKKLEAGEKQQIVQFYQSLGRIIMEQRISINRIFTCFNIDPAKLEMKRLNFNVSQFVTEQQFLLCLSSMAKYVVRGEVYNRILTSVRVFRFVNLCKDPRNRQIDVYYFMDKLINLLQFSKNNKIKQQIDLTSNPQQQQQLQVSPYNTESLSTPNQNPEINQQQFGYQVQNFCKASLKYAEAISHSLENKIRTSVLGLTKKTVTQWVTHASFNIFTICQYYRCDLLYGVLLGVLRAYGEGDFYSKSIGQLMKTMQIRFNQKVDNNILIILQQLLLKLATNSQFLQKHQKLLQKIHQKLCSELTSTKEQRNLQVLQTYKSLLIETLNTGEIEQSYKTKMKLKLTETIRKFIIRGVDICSLYDYRVMDIYFGILADGGCWAAGHMLADDGDFLHWIGTILSTSTLRQLGVTNSLNANKSKFILLITKFIIKFTENTNNPKLIRNSIDQIQESATLLYEECVQPKAEAHARQDYCLGYYQCSEFFCNYSKLSTIDQIIVNLILNLFILVRLNLITSNPSSIPTHKIHTQSSTKNRSRIKQKKSKAKQQQTQFDSMLGNIKYSLYNKQNNYNFKLPSCRVFNRQDIQQCIINEVVTIPEQNVYMYLHSLSKLFYCKLNILSNVHRIVPAFKYIFYYKKPFKRIMLILVLGVAVLEHSSAIMSEAMHQNPYFSHPAVKFVCILCLFVNSFYLMEEMATFVCKCRWYYPLKSSQLNEKLKIHTYSKRKTKTAKKQQIVNQNWLVGSSSDIKNITTQILIDQNNNQQSNPLDEKQKPQTVYPVVKPLKWWQIGMHFLNNSILVRILLITTYTLTIIDEKHFLFVALVQCVDIESSRTFLRAISKILVKLAFIVIFNMIYMVFCFVYFSTHAYNQQFSFISTQKMFLIHQYDAIYQNRVSPELPYQLAALFRFQQAISFISILIMIFYAANSIFQMQSDKKTRENKCWICLKNKKQIEARGENYDTHLAHEHRFLDYLYFFIEFDRKKKLAGIESQIQDQIKKGEYKFIKLH